MFENMKKNAIYCKLASSEKIKKPKGLSKGFFPSFAIKILLNL